MRLSTNQVFVDQHGTHHKITRIAGLRTECVTRRGERGNYTKNAVVIPRAKLLGMQPKAA